MKYLRLSMPPGGNCGGHVEIFWSFSRDCTVSPVSSDQHLSFANPTLRHFIFSFNHLMIRKNRRLSVPRVYTHVHKWLPEINKQKFTHPKLQRGVAIGGVAIEAEFVHCCKYPVVDLQIIVCIRRHVTLVYPIYPSLFAFQSEHNLEASCLLTLLV